MMADLVKAKKLLNKLRKGVDVTMRDLEAAIGAYSDDRDRLHR